MDAISFKKTSCKVRQFGEQTHDEEEPPTLFAVGTNVSSPCQIRGPDRSDECVRSSERIEARSLKRFWRATLSNARPRLRMSAVGGRCGHSRQRPYSYKTLDEPQVDVGTNDAFSGSAVASVTCWASAASSLVCSVSVVSCCCACSVESSMNSDGDFTPDILWAKSKAALVLALANSSNLLL